MSPKIHVLADLEAISRAAQVEAARLCREAVSARGVCTLALCGGSTPKRLYALLAEDKTLPFSKMHFFFGDERHVPPDDKDSNFRMVKEVLFSKAPIPELNIHRVMAELPAEEAAQLYEAELSRFFRSSPLPQFDVNIMGLGDEGHTASLFPGSSALHDDAHWVAAPYVDKVKMYRITLTPKVLNAARAVLFLVQGAAKEDAVKWVLEPGDAAGKIDEVPARVIQPKGEYIWYLDPAAAAKLKQTGA